MDLLLRRQPLVQAIALLAAALAIVSAPFRARAEEASLVKDIYPGALWGTPGCLADVNGTLFFQAYDEHGAELWKSDGTESGTVLVKDIDPGIDSSGPCYFTSVGGTVFFSATDGQTGRELWKTDGTVDGTMLVKDIWAGDYPGAQSEPFGLTNVKGRLLFSANDGQTGWELWKSDGTETGTVLVKDINPGAANSIGAVEPMVRVRSKVFFRALDESHGVELWRSNGKTAGTVLVKDINPGPASGLSPFVQLLKIGGTLYFPATDGSPGAQLWKSNGRRSGTLLVKNAKSSVSGAFLDDDLTHANGRLFFDVCTAIPDPEFPMYDCELWTSDGTEAGTVFVTRRGRLSSPPEPDSLVGVGGTLFFRGADYGLWTTDGTAAGTVRVSRVFYPRYLTGLNGKVFFQASDAAHGEELWMSDGTPGGTTLVRDIWPGAEGSIPQRLTVVGGTLFFAARDPDHGMELWAVHAPAP